MKTPCTAVGCEFGWIYFDKRNGGSVGKYKCERCHGKSEVGEEEERNE